MNPILARLNSNNGMIQTLLAMKNAGNDPNAILCQLMQNNQKFREFYEQNKNKNPEQIAADYGIDLNQVMQLFK